MLTDFPELGYQLGFGVALVIIADLVALSVISFGIYWAKGGYWHSSADITGFFSGVGAVCVAIGLAVVLFPYQPKYWQMYEVDTTVESVTNTFVDSSGEISSVPVVQLKGVDRPVEVKDPRVLNLKGRDVSFTCTMQWHYQAADSYHCKIREIKP